MNGQRGFTLIELMIAMALSTIGLIGLMKLQLVAINANGTSRNISEASGLAQERLEMLQVVPYANLSTYAITEPTLLAPSPGSTVQKLYTRTTTITGGAAAATTTIQVTVSWLDAQFPAHPPHTVTLFEVRAQ